MEPVQNDVTMERNCYNCKHDNISFCSIEDPEVCCECEYDGPINGFTRWEAKEGDIL